VFTWSGYVTDADVAAVNAELASRRIDVQVKVISPFAEGPEQMFDVLRKGEADLSFLTVNYIKMQGGRIAKLLQPIDTSRLSHYDNVLPVLAHLGMGVQDGKPLYVPFGGGAYGIWADMDRLRPDELPRSLQDLLSPRWRGKLSLAIGQVQQNVAMAFMAQGEPPFLLNQLIQAGKRSDGLRFAMGDSAEQRYLNALYAQVGPKGFWTDAPTFDGGFLLVASYGPEIAALRARGRNWQLVDFKEGNTVWMDTMNIVQGVSGAKLDAAYVFIDHILSDPVQRRVVDGLSMVAVVSTVKNPLRDANPHFFAEDRFWQPYDRVADNAMQLMSRNALKANGR
jgi:spermidine/putrescine-binding protein